MKNGIHKIAVLVLSAVLIFASLQPSADAGVPTPGYKDAESNAELAQTAHRVFQEYMEIHPEYQSVNIFDLDGDGIPEMFLRERTLPDDDEVTICLLEPDGINLRVCKLASKYMTIAYDPVNTGIVGESGGSGAAVYCLLTVERQKLFACFIGKEQVFSNDYPEFVYFLYGEPAEVYENAFLAYESGFAVNSLGVWEPDMDFFKKYAITEEEYLEYAAWFRECEPFCTEMIYKG